ncbi:hypothetical protein EJ04DRAFT_523278 [Polyplosphaeria fusca]|uniref:Uncharacterized protein n=1 Tax=Polyplosphaeria fusca TaxID=682080 RepID=A0A9P4QYN4_9PLEO|nr:hypothetical protein EJ04DRAFT_523278 [Polyplosphaeria fusca]
MGQADPMEICEETNSDSIEVSGTDGGDIVSPDTAVDTDDMMDVPSDGANEAKLHRNTRIAALINQYSSSYDDNTTSPKQQLEYAKVLACALLEHFYPADQDFGVVPCTFDEMAKYGWTIELKGNRSNVFALPLHTIAASNIAGFMVQKRHHYLDHDGYERQKWVPHTYLAIMIDPLDTLDRWTSHHQCATHPPDIMSVSMGKAHIAHSHAYVIIGNRIDFYRYNGASHKEMEPLGKTNWRLELKSDAASLMLIRQMFKAAAAENVVYERCVEHGEVGTGVLKRKAGMK